jgi:hypothetical protein
VAEPLSSGLNERAAAAVEKVPAKRVHVFCASCAERFFDGYAAWLTDEISLDERTASLPSPAFLRLALDVCWASGHQTEADGLVAMLKQLMPRDDEQPIFQSPLNDYFDVEPWLLQLGLSSILDPQVSFGVKASAAAIDFHWQLAIRRSEITGIGPAFDDPEWVHAFAVDPGAVAETMMQIEDAQTLGGDAPDWSAMRMRSADHGRRVLDEVKRLLGSPHPDRPPQAGKGNSD